MMILEEKIKDCSQNQLIIFWLGISTEKKYLQKMNEFYLVKCYIPSPLRPESAAGQIGLFLLTPNELLPNGGSPSRVCVWFQTM
jgi:hypothetical protein